MTATIAGSVPASSSIRRSRWRRIAGRFTAVCVVVAAGIGVHVWLTGEHVFMPAGATLTGQVPVGHTLYVGVGPIPAGGGAPDRSHRVDLRSITPLVTGNSSGATVTALLCATSGSGLAGGGSVLDDPTPFCHSLKPVARGEVTLGPAATGVILAITPRHSGAVHVEGVLMSYHDGIRSGRDHVGTVVVNAQTP